ncbi:MAG: TolC family protein [Candidatus Marinimicrobia bacterium]|nr:TolC family protein [Candidatus Neomarinimicrobiota bacterium]
MKRVLVLFIILSTFIIITAQNTPLTLEKCIEIALRESPDYILADYQVKISRTGILSSYNGILPRISTDLNATRSTQGPSEYVYNNIVFSRGDTTTYYYRTGLSLYQNIYDGGKWWYNIKLARNLYLNSEIYREQIRQWIILNVTQKYYEVLKAQQMLYVYQSALKSSEEQLKKSEELYKVKKVSQRDVYKAKVNLSNNKLNLLQQKTALENAKMELNIAMGRDAYIPIEVVEKEYTPPVKFDEEKTIETVLANNIELKLLNIEKKTSEIQYKINRANLFPSLYSTFSYSRGGSDFSKIYKPMDKWWNTSIGITLSWSIFDGFSRKANITKSYLEYKSYDEQIEKKKQDIIKQIEILLNQLNTLLEMYNISKISVKSAEEDLRLAQEMYKLKSATLLEVLDAQASLIRANATLISTMYDAKVIEARILYLMGKL